MMRVGKKERNRRKGIIREVDMLIMVKFHIIYNMDLDKRDGGCVA